MHIYPFGGHGFSLDTNRKDYLDSWLDRLSDWLGGL